MCKEVHIIDKHTAKTASALMCKQDFKSINIDWNAYKFM